MVFNQFEALKCNLLTYEVMVLVAVELLVLELVDTNFYFLHQSINAFLCLCYEWDSLKLRFSLHLLTYLYTTAVAIGPIIVIIFNNIIIVQYIAVYCKF